MSGSDSGSSAWPPAAYDQADQIGKLLAVLGVVCAIVTSVVFGLHVYSYRRHWTQPKTQTLVLRVVSLVPVWCILGLVNIFLPYAPYQQVNVQDFKYVTQIFLDLYESFAIISFMQLIYHYLGGKEQARWKAENKTPYRILLCVMVYPGERFMTILHYCIYQFAITRPLISTINCILVLQGVAKGKGSILSSPIDLMMTILTFVFLILAMWGLLQVYVIFRIVLRPYDVGKKFIAIKLYILLHVVQGFIFGFINNQMKARGDSVSPVVQENFIKVEYLLFCMEMVAGAFLNMYVFFQASEYVDHDIVIAPAGNTSSNSKEDMHFAPSNPTSYSKLHDDDIDA